jgi:hypothetical protein
MSGMLEFEGIEETSEGKFEAPEESIITCVSAARTIYTHLRTEHLKRIELYAQIKGLIGGNPPYNPLDLAAAGLDHVSNFNDMSANALIERACLTYWNLLYNARYLIEIKLKYVDPATGKIDPEATHYANLMSQAWTEAVMEEWDSFLTNLCILQAQLVELGVSPIIWPDEVDPRWRPVELSKFYVPNQTQSDIDMMTTVCVESEFTVQYLWEVYKEFKDKKESDSPWNVNVIGKLLAGITGIDKTPGYDGLGPTDKVEFETMLLSGDMSIDRFFANSVKIISLYQKEYSGKISHFMFPRIAGPNTMGIEEEFLFFEFEQYESWKEAMVIVTANPGALTIHINKGIGHKIFSLSQAKMMTENSLVDLSKWASTPMIKSGSLNTRDVDQIKFYPGVPTNLGSHELVQNNLGANLQGVVGAASHIGELLQRNISYSGSDPGQPDPDKGSLSPTQARLQATSEFNVQKNFISHYYSSQDRIFQGMTIKMLRSTETSAGYELKKAWFEKSADLGVPSHVLELIEAAVKAESKRYKMPRIMSVKATRVVGDGSQVAMLIGLQELGNIVPSFGARGSRRYQTDYICATVGPEHVDEYMSDNDTTDERSGGATIAMLENIALKAGETPLFSPDNDSRAHFVVHMQLAEQVEQQVKQQQMDAVQADSILRPLVQHLGEHLQHLAQSPFTQQLAESYKKPYGDLARYAAFTHRNAEAQIQKQMKDQQAAQEATQQVLSDEERKNVVTLNEERRKDIKLQAQNERQERAGTAKENALARKTEVDIRTKEQLTDAEVEAKKRKSGASSGGVENTADEQASANPSDYLNKINGYAPYNDDKAE